MKVPIGTEVVFRGQYKAVVVVEETDKSVACLGFKDGSFGASWGIAVDPKAWEGVEKLGRKDLVAGYWTNEFEPRELKISGGGVDSKELGF